MNLLKHRDIDRLRINGTYLFGYGITGIFLVCYAGVIIKLFSVWHTSYIYSYGLLVPFISLYLLLLNKECLKSIKKSPNLIFGAAVLLFSIIILVLGWSTHILSLQAFSLVLSIAGLTLLFFGLKTLTAVWFPIAYLLLMVPFWDRLTEPLNNPLQHFSAVIGTGILNVIGIPVYRSSVFIELPNITLEVARVCSGVNNLIAVVAIAIPLAYLTIQKWTKRILLVGVGVIIAILANSLRVGFIGILAYYGSAGDFHGPYHLLQSMSVSLVGFFGLFIATWILSDKRRISKASPNKTSINPDEKHDQALIAFITRSTPLLIATGAIIILGIYVFIRFYRQ